MIDLWKDYFPEVADTNKLGLLVNMMNIGSIVSFFITPYVADHFGRRIAIITGCLFMCLGGCLSAFANTFGRKLPPISPRLTEDGLIKGLQSSSPVDSCSASEIVSPRWPRPCS